MIKFKNILKYMKTYDFEDSSIIEKFISADVEEAEIMLNNSKNLKNLTFINEDGKEISLLTKTDRLDIIKLLINYDSEKNACYYAYGESEKHILECTENLKKAKIIINSYKDKDFDVFHYTHNGNYIIENVKNAGIVELLIKAGQNPHKGSYEKSVIESCQNIKKLEILIKYGADVNTITKDGKLLFVKFCEKNNKELKERIFIDEAFNPNAKDRKGNPLIFSLQKDEKKLIMSHEKFDPNVKNINGIPLLLALKKFEDNLGVREKNEENYNLCNLLINLPNFQIKEQLFNDLEPVFYLDSLSLLKKIYKSYNMIENVYDKDGHSIFFSTHINDNKFIDLLHHYNIPLDSKIFMSTTGENDFDDISEHLSIKLIKNKNFKKLELLLNYMNNIDSNSISKYCQDNDGNNLLAYLSTKNEIKELTKKYNINLFHKNKDGVFSIIKGLSLEHNKLDCDSISNLLCLKDIDKNELFKIIDVLQVKNDLSQLIKTKEQIYEKIKLKAISENFSENKIHINSTKLNNL